MAGTKASGSNTGQMVPQGAGNRAASGPPAGSQGAMRRRPSAPRGKTGGGGIRSAVANFYTDESPGIKLQPGHIIVLSLGFILFVTVLHIVGKLTGR